MLYIVVGLKFKYMRLFYSDVLKARANCLTKSSDWDCQHRLKVYNGLHLHHQCCLRSLLSSTCLRTQESPEVSAASVH